MRDFLMRIVGNTPILPVLPEVWRDQTLVYADIGARGGPPPEWLKLSRQINYICFEPDPEESAALELLFRNTESFTGTVCKRALGAENKKATLHLTNFRPSSSLLPPNEEVLHNLSVAKRFRIEQSIEVETGTLDEELRKIGRSCDFFKADVQGYELEILRGAKETLDQAVGCELEVSFIEIYKNQPLFADIDIFMRSRGFFLADLERIWWTRRAAPEELQERGTMAYGNVCYLKNGITMPSNRQTALKSSLVCAAVGLHELAWETVTNGAENGIFSIDEKQQFHTWVADCRHARRFWYRLSRQLSHLPGRQTLGRWLGLWSRALQGNSDTGGDNNGWLRRSSW